MTKVEDILKGLNYHPESKVFICNQDKTNCRFVRATTPKGKPVILDIDVDVQADQAPSDIKCTSKSQGCKEKLKVDNTMDGMSYCDQSGMWIMYRDHNDPMDIMQIKTSEDIQQGLPIPVTKLSSVVAHRELATKKITNNSSKLFDAYMSKAVETIENNQGAVNQLHERSEQMTQSYTQTLAKLLNTIKTLENVVEQNNTPEAQIVARRNIVKRYDMINEIGKTINLIKEYETTISQLTEKIKEHTKAIEVINGMNEQLL